MNFIKPNTNIDFIGKKKITLTFSLLIIIISLFYVFVNKGLNYGIDFAGGILVQIKFDSEISLEEIEDCLASKKLKSINVQKFGNSQENEYLIKTSDILNKKKFLIKVNTAFKNKSNFKIRRVEMVGPQVGKELRKKALLAIFYTLLFVAVYISGRFELKWFLSIINTLFLISLVYLLSLLNIPIPLLIVGSTLLSLIIFWYMNLGYAMGAIIALIHDVIITMGIFSILEKEFTLSIIAALLTTVGYSLNDTIIVFDRIRENLTKYKQNSLSKNVNKSINETLNRTILTSLTTLMVVCCLLIFGGKIIHNFAFALMIGVLTGTYSSIYIASPVLILLRDKFKIN